MYQSQLLELRQRLLYAEKENKKRSHELSSALDEIKRVVAQRMNLTINHTGLYVQKCTVLTVQSFVCSCFFMTGVGRKRIDWIILALGRSFYFKKRVGK